MSFTILVCGNHCTAIIYDSQKVVDGVQTIPKKKNHNDWMRILATYRSKFDPTRNHRKLSDPPPPPPPPGDYNNSSLWAEEEEENSPIGKVILKRYFKFYPWKAIL